MNTYRSTAYKTANESKYKSGVPNKLVSGYMSYIVPQNKGKQALKNLLHFYDYPFITDNLCCHPRKGIFPEIIEKDCLV